MRNFKGFTQKQIAQELCMGITAYNRREKGEVSININQWEKLAEILDVPLREIFEPDEKQVFICNDNTSVNYQGTNHIHSVKESLIETQLKYITKLEEENAALKRLLDKT